MGTIYTSTGTITNVTRLELEQLRKADFFAGGKALTVGDSGLSPEGVVGVGSINAEPYSTGQSLSLEDIYSVRPSLNPGRDISTVTQGWTGGMSLASETATWLGPTLKLTSTGYASSISVWTDTSGVDLTLTILVGDVVCIKAAPSTSGPAYAGNDFAVGTVQSLTSTTLTLTAINNPSNPSLNTTQLESTTPADTFTYVIIRPSAVQLFAVPGSGPQGREQSFLMVHPLSTLHANVAPTAAQIAADRVRSIVPPGLSASASVDRADAVFAAPGPRQPLSSLGYRVVLYKSNSAGTGVDLAQPIASLSPVIDSTIPAAEQRMTFDYKAGVVRLSVAPRAGDDIKPTGGTSGTHPTTGRLQLYAVYWALDQTSTLNTANGLYGLRSTEETLKSPSRVYYDGTNNVWKMGSTTSTGSIFTVKAHDPAESGNYRVEFGAYSSVSFSSDRFRGFRIADTLVLSLTGGVTSASILTDTTRNFFALDVRMGDTVVVPSGLAAGTYKIQVVAPTILTLTPAPVATTGVAYQIWRRPPIQMRVGEKVVSTDPDTLIGVESKSAYTVGDSTGLSPSSDFNSIIDFKPQGLRNITSELQEALIQASYSSYGVVRLSRGLYSNISTTQSVYLPPGVMLEGEGFGTTFQSATTSFRFGANTTWGVYDPTSFSSGASVSPTTMSLISGGGETGASFDRVEGMDIVWNAARRVWATFVANTTTGQLLFNEMRTDGSLVFAEPGIDIKNSAFTFFTRASSNSSRHTVGHYPRVDHSPHLDAYAVTWVEENLGGAFCVVQILQYNPALVGAARYSKMLGTTAGVPLLAPTYEFSYQPSVAFNLETTLPLLRMSFGAAVQNTVPTATPNFWAQRYSFTGTSGVAGSWNLVSAFSKVWVSGTDFIGTDISSTDVILRSSTATHAFSVRSHQIIISDTGTTDGSGDGIIDPISNPTWPAGVGRGSRMLYLGGGASVDRGLSGVVDSNVANDLVTYWDDTSSNITPSQIGIRYAVIPTSRIYVCSSTVITQVAGITSDSNEVADREPDFVRLSCSSEQNLILLAFQNFDTVATLSRVNGTNFDGRFEPVYLDQASSVLAASNPSREHLGTSYLLLSSTTSTLEGTSQFQIVYPTKSRTLVNGGLTTTPLDLSLVQRSLGARPPMVPLPNTFQNYVRPYNDISPRQYMQIVTGGLYPSLIPDVSWNGSDWVVVSPTVDFIHSDTGNYVNISGTNYLIDASYLFGSDAVPAGTDTHLPGTISGSPTGFDLFFPAFNHHSAITAISSEHVVSLPAIPGAVPPLYNVSWVANLNGSTSKHVKTPGFRVSPDGTVIQSTSYTTFDNTKYSKQVQEVLNHGVLGSFAGFGAVDYGANSRSWIDLVDGYRLSGDLHYRGVCVGSPKKSSGYSLAEHTTPSLREAPLVAISCGDNYYGFVDIEKFKPTTSTYTKRVRAFRQTFGPWNSGIKALKIKAASDQLSSLNLDSTSYVYTRHGFSNMQNPFFATDGFRAVFPHLAFSDLNGLENNPVVGDSQEEESYRTTLCVSYTNANGEFPIKKRVAIVTSEENASVTGVMPKVPVWDYLPYGFRGDLYPTRTVWTGSTFIAVVATPRRILFYDLGGGEGGKGNNQFLSGISSNTTHTRLNGVAYIDTGYGGPKAVSNSSKNPPPPVAPSKVYAPDLRDSEIPDYLLTDVAWSGNTLAVVWSAGAGATAVTRSDAYNGGHLLGITLYTPTLGLQENTSLGSLEGYLFNPGQINTRTYILDSSGGGGAVGFGQDWIYDPKITWSKYGFVISYVRGVYDDEKSLFTVCVPENGYGGGHTIKDVTSFNNDDPNFGPSTRLGSIDITDGTLTLEDDKSVMVGDLIQITRTAPALGSSSSTYPYYEGYAPAAGSSLGVIGTEGSFTSGSTIFTDLTKNFGALGVMPGDFLVMRTVDPNERPVYPIRYVGSTTLILERSFENTDFSQDYYVMRPSSPAHNFSGIYTVRSFNVATKRVDIGINLMDDYIVSADYVYGMIITGQGSQPRSLSGGADRRFLSGPSGLLQSLEIDFGSGVSDEGISNNHGLFYSEVRDEFVSFLSVGSGSGDLVYAIAWPPNREKANTVVRPLMQNGAYPHLAVGWNGEHFLLAKNISGTNIQTFLLSADLGSLNSNSSALISASIGDTVNEAPGPGYSSLVSTDTINTIGVPGTAQPLLCITWNPVSCKWMVAASIKWRFTNNYVSENSFLYYRNAGTKSIRPAYEDAAQLVSYIGRTIVYRAAGSTSSPRINAGIRLIPTAYEYRTSLGNNSPSGAIRSVQLNAAPNQGEIGFDRFPTTNAIGASIYTYDGTDDFPNTVSGSDLVEWVNPCTIIGSTLNVNGRSNGTVGFLDTTTSFSSVLPGDRLVIVTGPTSRGTYNIASVGNNTLTVDRPIPTGTGINYTIVRPTRAAYRRTSAPTVDTGSFHRTEIYGSFYDVDVATSAVFSVYRPTASNIFQVKTGSTNAPRIGAGGTAGVTTLLGTLLTDGTKNFTTLGVQIGDILTIASGSASGIYRITAVGTTTVTLDMQTVAAAGITYTISGPKTLGVGNHTSSSTDIFAPYSRMTVLQREDVFLYTFSSRPAIRIDDADGVFVDSVVFEGGVTDVQVNTPNMSRPTWKTSGLVYGQPGNSHPAVPFSVPVFPTPQNKTTMVTFTNVRTTHKSSLFYPGTGKV